MDVQKATVIPVTDTFDDYLDMEIPKDAVTEEPVDPYSIDTSPGKPIKVGHIRGMRTHRQRETLSSSGRPFSCTSQGTQCIVATGAMLLSLLFPSCMSPPLRDSRT